MGISRKPFGQRLKVKGSTTWYSRENILGEAGMCMFLVLGKIAKREPGALVVKTSDQEYCDSGNRGCYLSCCHLDLQSETEGFAVARDVNLKDLFR